MKLYGIYNQYAQEWWTDDDGIILEFDSKKEAQSHISLESMLYNFDNFEAKIMELL